MNNKKEKKIIYIAIQNSQETTDLLLSKVKEILDQHNISYSSYIPKNETHITLFHKSDGDINEFSKNFTKGQLVNYTIHKIAYDEKCICLSVTSNVLYYPKDKNLHITLMLNNCSPVYSNELLAKSNYNSIDFVMDLSGHIMFC